MAQLRAYSFDNGVTLAAGFTQQNTSNPIIEFGGVGYTAAGPSSAFDANNTYGAAHYSEVTLDSTINDIGPTVCAKQQDASRDHYFAQIFNASFWKIFKCIDTTDTQIGSTGTFSSSALGRDVAADDVVRLEYSAGTLTMKVGATTVDTQSGDGALTTGSAGFRAGGGNMRAWAGGDLGGGGGVIASAVIYEQFIGRQT